MAAVKIGYIGVYTMTADDANQVNRRRTDAALTMGIENTRIPPEVRPAGAPGRLGTQRHVGKDHALGDQLPCIVVFTPDGILADLQVFLDGNDTLWLTSVTQVQNTPGSYW